MNKRIAKKMVKNWPDRNYNTDQLRRALCKLRYGHVARTAILGAHRVESK